MPLYRGVSNIGRNIRIEEAAGKPFDQAKAIALHMAYLKKQTPAGKAKEEAARKAKKK